MRGTEFLDKMELIAPAYVAAAEAEPKRKKSAWGKWGAMAACVCLIAATAISAPELLSGDVPAPPDPPVFPISSEPTSSGPVEGSEYTGEPGSPWAAVFNEPIFALDASRVYIPGYFTEELSAEELAALKPAVQFAYMEYSGRAGFDGDGNLVDVFMNVTTSIPACTVAVAISEHGPRRCYQMDGEPVISTSNHVDFTVYQWSPTSSKICLEADAVIGRYNYCFSLETSPESVEKAKADFQCILESFSCWADGKPDLSTIKADAIPEFFDLKLTLSEARADADFGAYLPDALPSGYVEESIRRYRDQNHDYLSGLWTKGYDQLSWQVSSYTERDAERLTGIDEPENYDLSLYPIPRAESVPDELREIVDDPIFIAEDLTLETVCARAYKSGESGDSNGWRMTFGVKYGDVLIRVSSKGLEPEWMYRQLTGLLEK